MSFDIQVHTVDYQSQDSLSYALQGIDLVISTVSGPEQIRLILAADKVNVRHFVPAEFEGSLGARRRHSSTPDTLRQDSYSTQALEMLRHLRETRRMGYTVFSCGILMEMFHPSGLGYFSMGSGFGVSNPGDYILNVNTGTAVYTDRSTSGRKVRICLTSAYDLARFIVAALDLGPAHWPTEYTLRGDRLSLEQLVDTCGQLQNSTSSLRMLQTSVCLLLYFHAASFTQQIYSVQDLATYLDYSIQAGDTEQIAYYQRQLATAHGRFDFSQTTLNDAISASRHVEFVPMTFHQWLTRILYPTPE